MAKAGIGQVSHYDIGGGLVSQPKPTIVSDHGVQLFAPTSDALSRWFHPDVDLAELKLYYPDWLNWLFKHSEAPDVGVVIAVCNDRLAGLVIYSQRHEKVKIDTLFILPEFRQKGLSAVLWDMLSSKLGKVCVEVTLKPPALPFWKSTLIKRSFKELSSAEDRAQGKLRFFSSQWQRVK